MRGIIWQKIKVVVNNSGSLHGYDLVRGDIRREGRAAPRAFLLCQGAASFDPEAYLGVKSGVVVRMDGCTPWWALDLVRKYTMTSQ